MLDSFKFLANPSPSYMIFWVTQNCNARCEFCFNWESNLQKNNDLSIKEIEQLAQNYNHLKYLTIAGGEPTLRSDLPAIVAAFVEYSGLQICSIVTNGIKWESLLKQAEEICVRYPNLALNIGVSIDYIGEQHDVNRKAKGCYDGAIKIIQGVKELRRSTCPNLMVNAVGTYTKESQDSILQTACTIMKEYKIPYVLNLIRGEVEDNNLKEVDIHQYYKVAREILEMEKKVIPQTTFQSNFRFALEEMGVDNIYQSVVTGQMQSHCVAGRETVVLESNGKLRLCEILPDDFGNVRDNAYNIPTMLQSAKAEKIVSNILKNNCHCTWECVNRANIAYDFKKWPKLLVTGFQKALIAKR